MPCPKTWTSAWTRFRYVLVHRYLDIDPDEVLSPLDRAFDVLPAFAREVMDWLDEVPDDDR